jgi:LysM repeat protein
MKKILFASVLLISATAYAQLSDTLRSILKIDTSFAVLQYADPAIAASLQRQLAATDKEKFVIYHYGGSHIQAGKPPRVARRHLQQKYGDGGLGMIFSYGAADTYSSVLYSSGKTGTWGFGKSYVSNPKVPLGVCGMGVETAQNGATLDFGFKEPLKKQPYLLRVLTDADSTNFGFKLQVNDQTFGRESMRYIGSGMFEVQTDIAVEKIVLTVVKEKEHQSLFRFYGIDIETPFGNGLVYHSLGVGAAAFRSVLQLEKMPVQSEVLKPDMVILDFGTNDILYTNSIDDKLPGQVEKAIANFRRINPDILVVLTSTQDLYRKGRYISAGVSFVHLMDSLAKRNNCFFWNWYDLAGGYGTITTWTREKYALSDGIHLTPAGYEVKGEMLYRSIENTLAFHAAHPNDQMLVPQKTIDFTVITPPKPAPQSAPASPKARKVYTVRSGDTLSEIAAKNRTTVAKIKKANSLRSDRISVGQKLKIPG